MKKLYYISSGELNKMYTLRVSYKEIRQLGNVTYTIPRDYYCINLSIDHDTAYKKAQEYVNTFGDNNSILVEQSEVPTLNDIYRRNQKELEIAKKIAQETAIQAQKEYEERILNENKRKAESILNNIWPFGKYKGRHFGRELSYEPIISDKSYIKFFIELNIEINDEPSQENYHNEIIILLQKQLKLVFPELANLPKPNGKFYGIEKQREDFNLICLEYFHYNSMYGTTYIQKFVKDTGELIVYRGSAPIKCEVGNTIIVTGTIKHDCYKNENQTLIKRPKLISAY